MIWGCNPLTTFMLQFYTTIRRIAFALLFLTTALSAQRYTGHDHAVFHRPPQPPPSAVKRQTPSPANGSTSRPKTTATASAASQQASRTASGQGKLDVDLNHPSAPAKTDPPTDDAPRM